MSDTVIIDQPGVYDIPDAAYLQDPVPGGSLSSSGARKLLPPSCPALFKYWRDHGQTARRDLEFGKAAHQMVLGVGADLVVIDAPDYKTKPARLARDKATAAGAVPLLRHEHQQVQDMAAAILEHPDASALFDPANGNPEQSLFWTDEPTGVRRRARLDWLPNSVGGGRLIVPDYKTAKSVEPHYLQKAMYDFGYYQQGPYYLDGVVTLGLHGGIEPAFLLVFQMKEPPYLVTIAQPDWAAMRWGRARNREAIDIYTRCIAEDRWPGYADDVIPLSLPPWAERQQEAAYENTPYDQHWSAA